MPNWSGTVLTAKGLALQAKVEAGTTMEITKLKIGDGVLAGGQSVSALNDLVSPKKIIDISALTPLASGTCKIHGVVTNVGIETGFYVRELGVFAQDPDLGEILYAYTADGAPDFLPAEGGPVAVSEELVINLAFSNAATITANIELDGLVTVNVLNNALQQYLPLAGGVMIGSLILADDPVEEMEAATKRYVALYGGMNNWQANKVYVVGDICFSKNAASYKRMECVEAGTTDEEEPTWTAVGTLVTDGTVTWIVDDVRDGTPVGRPVLDMLLRPGYIELTGATYSRAAYPRLWRFATSNSLTVSEADWAAGRYGLFGVGDGSTTFRAPKNVDEFLRALNTATGRLVGSSQGDAIRNITGGMGVNTGAITGASGAFSPSGSQTNVSAGTGGSGYTYVSMDASLVVPTATENRPHNVAYYGAIKY